VTTLPNRPYRPCKHTGCASLTRDQSGYCEVHQIDQAQHSNDYDKHRGSPSKRGYDLTWQRLRLLYLHAHPLCEDCEEQGRVEQAVEVHHVVAIRNDKSKRLDDSNLRALCKLMQDNLPWFKNNIIVDCLEKFLSGMSNDEEFKMSGIKVHIYDIPNTEKVKIKYENHDGESLIDNAEYEFSNENIEAIQKKLRELAILLDEESPEVQNFLKSRTNYR